MKVQKAEKAEQRLKQKAVKQHQDFKEAVEVLRKHKMNAKRGRLLLKRHYVALIEDAGGVSDPGRMHLLWIACPYTHLPPYIHIVHSVHSHAHITHTPQTYIHTPPLEKQKVTTLKNLFWSRPDVYTKYTANPDASSAESSSDDDDDDVVSACA